MEKAPLSEYVNSYLGLEFPQWLVYVFIGMKLYLNDTRYFHGVKSNVSLEIWDEL